MSLKFIVHTIKGAAANIGGQALSAAEIEAACRAGDTDQVHQR